MSEIPHDVEVYLLGEFLSDQRKLKEKGITLETVFMRMGDLSAAQSAMNLRQNRHGDRIRKLEKTVNGEVRDADSEENSKVHRLQELQMARELSEMKKDLGEDNRQKHEEEVWWKRQRWVWGGALLLALFGTFSSACTGLIIWKVTAPPTLSR